jgi:hypothetical protein
MVDIFWLVLHEINFQNEWEFSKILTSVEQSWLYITISSSWQICDNLATIYNLPFIYNTLLCCCTVLQVIFFWITKAWTDPHVLNDSNFPSYLNYCLWKFEKWHHYTGTNHICFIHKNIKNEYGTINCRMGGWQSR